MIKRDGFVLVHKTCETPCLFWYVKKSNRFTKKYTEREGMCMDSKYGSLFTPWKIGNVEIKNRIVMCSMGGGGTCLFGFAEPNHWDEEAQN